MTVNKKRLSGSPLNPRCPRCRLYIYFCPSVLHLNSSICPHPQPICVASATTGLRVVGQSLPPLCSYSPVPFLSGLKPLTTCMSGVLPYPYQWPRALSIRVSLPYVEWDNWSTLQLLPPCLGSNHLPVPDFPPHSPVSGIVGWARIGLPS